jgi:hypothetical protein
VNAYAEVKAYVVEKRIEIILHVGMYRNRTCRHEPIHGTNAVDVATKKKEEAAELGS